MMNSQIIRFGGELFNITLNYKYFCKPENLSLKLKNNWRISTVVPRITLRLLFDNSNLIEFEAAWDKVKWSGHEHFQCYHRMQCTKQILPKSVIMSELCLNINILT